MYTFTSTLLSVINDIFLFVCNLYWILKFAFSLIIGISKCIYVCSNLCFVYVLFLCLTSNYTRHLMNTDNISVPAFYDIIMYYESSIIKLLSDQ